MLTFFRRIRKRLLIDGGTSKYLLYAIGEILLVMIGILLALQVNNWNEQRKNKIAEKEVLYSLKKEFELNKAELVKTKASVQKCYKGNLFLMSLIGKNLNELQSYNIDSLVLISFGPAKFSPTQNVLKGLMESDRFQLVSDARVKELLMQWDNTILTLEDKYLNINKHGDEHIYNYLKTRYPYRNIDMYSPLKIETPSILAHDKYEIFMDLEYENLLDNMAFFANDYLYYLLQLEEIIERFLALPFD